MNILVINHYAGSPQHGMEYRPYYLAREWVKAGHNVHIISSAESHVRAKQPDLQTKNRLDETIDNIHYTWFKTAPYTGNGVGRVRNMANFILRLYRDAANLVENIKPDVVIASSTYPMDIWPAHRIAKLANAKLIFEVHDLWPLSPMELGGISKWHPFILLVQQAEDYAYRHAGAVVSMLPRVHAHMESRGLDLQKLHIIPNGIDPAEWQNQSTPLPENLTQLFAQCQNQGIPVVGYAGAHGVANALDSLLDTAKLMQRENIQFVLIGNGSEKAALAEKVRHENISNVTLFEPVRKEQIPTLLQHFDIAYIGWHHQPLYRFGIAPNKLMDYMMAGKVVLHSVEAGNDPVTEAGCGLTVPPENPQAIAQGIHHLLTSSTAERIEMGQQGRNYVLQHHTYPVLAERFLKVMQDV